MGPPPTGTPVDSEPRGDAVILWFYDSTASEGEMRRLRADFDDLSDAFDALTGLVEAAPLPMWYRDGDLQLAMVNSAYVTAVEGSDAAEVVGRGLELVDGSGQGSPSAGAALARDEGRPQQRVLPATIGVAMLAVPFAALLYDHKRRPSRESTASVRDSVKKIT